METGSDFFVSTPAANTLFIGLFGPCDDLWRSPETLGCALTSKVTIEIHEGDVFPLLLPLDAWVLLLLRVEHARQHCVWKTGNAANEIFMAEQH